MQPTEANVKLLKKFIAYCADKLTLKDEIQLTLLTSRDPSVPSAGQLDPNTGEIRVCISNRAMADCMRTCAHELTHLKQLLVDKIEFPEDDENLQPYEDEANVQSGRLVRFFGRENPEIYQDM